MPKIADSSSSGIPAPAAPIEHEPAEGTWPRPDFPEFCARLDAQLGMNRPYDLDSMQLDGREAEGLAARIHRATDNSYHALLHVGYLAAQPRRGHVGIPARQLTPGAYAHRARVLDFLQAVEITLAQYHKRSPKGNTPAR